MSTPSIHREPTELSDVAHTFWKTTCFLESTSETGTTIMLSITKRDIVVLSLLVASPVPPQKEYYPIIHTQQCSHSMGFAELYIFILLRLIALHGTCGVVSKVCSPNTPIPLTLLT